MKKREKPDWCGTKQLAEEAEKKADNKRKTKYADEIVSAALVFVEDDTEARVERLRVHGNGQVEIRFSWWGRVKKRKRSMINRPLDLPEDDLLKLMALGIEANVFTPEFRQQLKDKL